MAAQKTGDEKILAYITEKLQEPRFLELEKQIHPELDPNLRLAYAITCESLERAEKAVKDILDINEPIKGDDWGGGLTFINYAIFYSAESEAALFLANHPDLNPLAENEHDGENTFQTLKTHYRPEVQVKIIERLKNGDFDRFFPDGFTSQMAATIFEGWNTHSPQRKEQRKAYAEAVRKRKLYTEPIQLSETPSLEDQFLKAAQSNDAEAIRRLRSAGVNINCKTRETSLSALHLIAANEAYEALVALEEDKNLDYLQTDFLNKLPSNIALSFNGIGYLAAHLMDEEIALAKTRGIDISDHYWHHSDDLNL